MINAPQKVSAWTLTAAIVLAGRLRSRWQSARESGDTGAQTIDIAIWVGIITILAIVVLYPQIKDLLTSLIAKFRTE